MTATPTPCPACRQPMSHLTLPKRDAGQVNLDLCFPCQGIWFDDFESYQISPGGIIELFKLIHAHRDEMRMPHPEQWIVPTRAASALTSIGASWRTKPFSIMNWANTVKRPCFCRQRW